MLVEPGNNIVGPRTVVVQLALIGVGNQVSAVSGTVLVDGERQAGDGGGRCCRWWRRGWRWVVTRVGPVVT